MINATSTANFNAPKLSIARMVQYFALEIESQLEYEADDYSFSYQNATRCKSILRSAVYYYYLMSRLAA